MKTPFQYSCLENSTNRGAWWATVNGDAKNWKQPGDGTHTHTHTHTHTREKANRQYCLKLQVMVQRLQESHHGNIYSLCVRDGQDNCEKEYHEQSNNYRSRRR